MLHNRQFPVDLAIHAVKIAEPVRVHIDADGQAPRPRRNHRIDEAVVQKIARTPKGCAGPGRAGLFPPARSHLALWRWTRRFPFIQACFHKPGKLGTSRARGSADHWRWRRSADTAPAPGQQCWIKAQFSQFQSQLTDRCFGDYPPLGNYRHFLRHQRRRPKPSRTVPFRRRAEPRLPLIECLGRGHTAKWRNTGR